MKDQINTIRYAIEMATPHYQADTERFKQALTALTQLEAMVGRQEPVQLDHIACIDGGELRYMTGRKAPAYDCELYAMPDGKRAPNLYAAPVAQQARADLEAENQRLREALEELLRHFTRSPSSLADSETRIKAHAALESKP